MRLILLLCCSLSLTAAPPAAQILYKMRQGAMEAAIVGYKQYSREKGSHDFALLQQMALAIIQECALGNHEMQLLALWASSFSLNPKLLPVLSKGLKKEDPRDVLASLFFLMNFPDDRALQLIQGELSSPWLPIQATAAEFLIQKKEKGILEIVSRLLDRVDPHVYPLFVPLFAPSTERFATCWMKKFLQSSDPQVRLAALLSVAEQGRDDLLPEIRQAARTGNLQEKEVAAAAIGILGDSESLPLLQELAACGDPAICLSASQALVTLGQPLQHIAQAAAQGNLFAINLLGQLKLESDLLAELLTSSDLEVRANATVALLASKDPRGLTGLLELLNPNLKNLVLVGITSPGHALKAWQLKARTVMKEQPLVVTLPKTALIEQASTLAKDAFLEFADKALQFEDKETVPAIIWAVKDKDSGFLERQLNRPGAPLARSWATLALYNLKEKGPYAEHVQRWFVEMKSLAIVSVTPPTLATSLSHFQVMTKQESCQLLLAALDTIANARDQTAIDALLDALVGGNPLNRPVIASLLLRLSE